MSLQIWPLDPPGHLEQIDQQVEIAMRRTVMETGRVRQKPRFSVDLATHNIRFYFTDAEWATFQTFFQQSINNGQDPFTMNMRVGGAGGVQPYTVQFICGGSGGPYSIKFQEPFWLLTAQVQIQGMPLVSEATLNDFIDRFEMVTFAGVQMETFSGDGMVIF
jgi:hypothetical protein